MLERRDKTRRYAAIFDEKGIPLPSATCVVIGGAPWLLEAECCT
jgi:hypothetical protein